MKQSSSAKSIQKQITYRNKNKMNFTNHNTASYTHRLPKDMR